MLALTVVHPLTSLSKGGMSTEYLYALLGGEDAEIASTSFPYYVDVSAYELLPS